MSTHLCITVRWVGDRFHGFIDGTEILEWPPSPYRLFQALLAGAHRYGMDTAKSDALAWIERQRIAPDVLASPQPSTGPIFDHFVPDNDDFLKHRRRGIRKFCPTLLEASPLVHYVWRIDPSDPPTLAALDDLTSTLGSLGWAIDQAYAVVTLTSVQQMDAAILGPDRLSRFLPAGTTTMTNGSLRVPKPGSIRDLERVHSMNCIASGNQAERRRKKWPKVFDRVLYTSVERPIGRPHVVFKLIDENEDAYRYPHAKLIHIAGMVRHLAIKACSERPADWVERVVRGKRDESASDEHKQFSYVPLPSIGHAHADAMIRNVMIIAPLGMERELNYLAERLDGRTLEPEDNAESADPDLPPSLSERVELQRFTPPRGKFIDKCYLGTSSVWESVTPVILDGCNRKSKSDKPEAVARATEKLIRKALLRAGIEAPCEFTWQSLPFIKNTLSAHKYDRQGRRTGYFRPTYLHGYTAVHLRIRFGHRVPGPITIGAGRHCGLGIFAAID